MGSDTTGSMQNSQNTNRVQFQLSGRSFLHVPCPENFQMGNVHITLTQWYSKLLLFKWGVFSVKLPSQCPCEAHHQKYCISHHVHDLAFQK